MSARNILLVEDNPDDAELAVRAFRAGNAGQEIQVAHDGAEAVEALFGSTSSAPPRQLPSLVLLDLKLPGLDGFAVLSRIRIASSHAVSPRRHPDVVDGGLRPHRRLPARRELIRPQAILIPGLRCLGKTHLGLLAVAERAAARRKWRSERKQKTAAPTNRDRVQGSRVSGDSLSRTAIAFKSRTNSASACFLASASGARRTTATPRRLAPQAPEFGVTAGRHN